MNRLALAIGAGVLAIASIALWLALKKEAPAPHPHVAPTSPVAPVGPGAQRASAPQVAAGSDGVQVNEDGSREYMVGDVLVRDHRKGSHEKLDVPPNVHSPQGPRIPSTLTAQISQRFKVVLTECAAAVPPEARGASPRLDGQLVVKVKDGQVTVTGATAQLRDVVGAAVDPTKQCIEQHAIGLTLPADPETPEVENYSISLSVALP